MEKLINISQLSELLNFINPKTKKPSNHIIRYWEKEFKQINPIIINKRRYYSKKQIDIIKLVKFLLKDKGLTIKGVKSMLNSKINTLDDNELYSLKNDFHKENMKNKSKSILEKIKKIKKYGRKNSY